MPRNDQPEIPTDHYSYLEFELEQAGSLAAMIGVTTSCDLDRGPLQVVGGEGSKREKIWEDRGMQRQKPARPTRVHVYTHTYMYACACMRIRLGLCVGLAGVLHKQPFGRRESAPPVSLLPTLRLDPLFPLPHPPPLALSLFPPPLPDPDPPLLLLSLSSRTINLLSCLLSYHPRTHGHSLFTTDPCGTMTTR